MSDSTALADRIKAEFEAHTQRQQAEQQDRAKEGQERDARLVQFGKVCDDLKSIWRPRFEDFAKQFGEKIRVTPSITPAMREAKIVFLTDLATVTLSLTVSPNAEVTKLVLDYDLLIIPIYFEYERHARLEVSLDKIDRDAIGKWIDDHLISCVKAYLVIQDNEHYLKRAMVEDPITKTRMLRGDAAATLEHKGKTLYFSTADSLRQYKQKQEITD